MKEQTNLIRRRLLASAGGAVAWAGFGGSLAHADSTEPASSSSPGPVSAEKPLPGYAKWKDANSMIVHSANTVETRRDAFGSAGITPLDRLYIRNNLTPPSEDIVKDPDSWKVEISGVKSPRSFTVAELKTLGLETVTMVLQCSGNGRGFFPHKPSGTQWTVGAAGCVSFTGVPVKAVLEATGGMADGMKYMTSTGGEEIPAGLDPNTLMVERSVPLSGIEDAILAWEVNGEALPLAHGGPLRMIVPGYAGVNNVKYVKHVAFTKDQSPAKIQQSSYRFSPIGVKGTPEYDSIWEMDPKSWITMPSDPNQPVKAGRVQITGVAMGGMSEPEKVEVSVDGGKSWKEAEFIGPDLGKYAWRSFVLSAELKPGTYQMACRVTNEDGKSQPENRVENNRGYVNNSWRDHMVAIKVA
ncbi:sulfite oxidase [Allopusillimonas soli]|uniref:Sulfite oxidase n=1 Tax=Allopusillimonas soli TaxID=659016 RepID=A0A853F7K7_9BURK|nr:sulfite oxidase [Allopusillimonas soli]NYT35967.1 sulfite oxidase [Allopusillimonas soli]TEA76314.1 sulfite oxidase [Allopusillimonas soli]